MSGQAHPAAGRTSGGGVAVYGLGRSGLAVVRRAVTEGRQVVFYERRPGGPDVDEATSLGAKRVATASDWLPPAATPQYVVAAPGVPIDHPDLVALAAAGCEVIGEVEWVWREVPGRYVGVTGTAGKGSVTRWTGDLLAASGADVAVGGNIDPALAAVARPGFTHVVELSSFQLERCPTFAADVAVVLNLGEDHIDRHGSVAAYHEAKHNLVRNLRAGATLVVNADDAKVASWGDEAAARGVDVRRFSLAAPDASAGRDEGGTLWLAGEPLLHQDELAVRGDHQVANGLAAALAASACGLSADQVRAGLRRFEGLPGRYSKVGRVGHVDFIEDSIATRPLAVLAALRATPRPLVWLAGGRSKGSNIGEVVELVKERVDLVIAFGESADEFAEAFGKAAPTVKCERPTGEETMRALVQTATEYLSEHHGGRGSVLLAPLATSFDQFQDYRARGRAFERAVADAARESGQQEEQAGVTAGG